MVASWALPVLTEYIKWGVTSMASGAINLYEAKKNGDFTVVSTPDIGLLENLGVRSGASISLQNRYALGGPVVLRARLPDLKPMDFLLWGHIKALIYLSPVDFEKDLIDCIIEAAATVRQQPGILECTHQFAVMASAVC